MLKTAGLTTSVSSRIVKKEADLNDSCGASSHKRIAENSVNHGTEWKVLWVCAHAPSSHNDHYSWYDIASWFATPASAQPDSQQARTPPDNSHAGMLEVVGDPWSTPSMFGERVDASPCCNDNAIEELLAPACPS